ncbi:hypothetical protein SDC9_163954 [bioreactor metagenome]|uniref:Uncharacterized protein n=1 Tax=bioreactor metagenome TaxID=1076179 RepID=A0A645FT36_9ZZZZ
MICFSTKLRAYFKSSIMTFTASNTTANPYDTSKGCSYSIALGIVFYVSDLGEKQQ